MRDTGWDLCGSPCITGAATVVAVWPGPLPGRSGARDDVVGRMSRFRDAFESRTVVVHTAWATGWTGLFVVLAVTVGGDRPQIWWGLAVAVLVGLSHLLLRVGRWADRRGAANAITRRVTRMAWWLPVALVVFVLLDAVGI